MSDSGTTSPFDDLRQMLANLPEADETARGQVIARDKTLTKPQGSLGRLEEIAEWLAAWQGKAPPSADRPLIALFAANHGVAARGISAYPTSVTAQMVQNFSSGGAAVNQLAQTFGAGLQVYELALDYPTPDIAEAEAMNEKDCMGTIVFGMQALEQPCDILCLGEMGIGNTTIAAALSAALYGGSASDWVGCGTGIDDEGRARKLEAVEAALTHHGDALDDPLEALRRVGGREFAALAGAIAAARFRQVPVLLDGYAVTAAAAVLERVQPGALDHCIAAHVSQEPGHRLLLEKLGKKPLLDLDLRLGEGSGAVLALGLVKAAAAVHRGMATFEDAGISGPVG